MKKKLILTVSAFLLSLIVTGCGCHNDNPVSSITSQDSSLSTSSTRIIIPTSSQGTTSSSATQSSSQSSVASSSSSEIIKQSLFISEFWNINDVSNNNKALELYNPNDFDIDLSTYSINIYTNGSSEVLNSNYTFSLSGTLPSKTCYVIVNNSAKDELKAYGDLTSENLFISSKCAVGLYNNNQLVDLFGEIGKSYASDNDVVINQIQGATSNHNLKRDEGVRNTPHFSQGEWIVAYDNDMSTLGVHEEDTLTKPQKEAKQAEYKANAEIALNNLISKYYTLETSIFTGDITLYKTYEGFSFSYDMQCAASYYDENGKMIKEPADKTRISIYVSVLNEDGSILETNYFAGGTYRTYESIIEEQHAPYKKALEKLIKDNYGSGSYDVTGDITLIESYIVEGVTYHFKYNFAIEPCSKYFASDGSMISTPENGFTFAFEISVVDNNNTTIVIDTQEVNCTFVSE